MSHLSLSAERVEMNVEVGLDPVDSLLDAGHIVQWMGLVTMCTIGLLVSS